MDILSVDLLALKGGGHVILEVNDTGQLPQCGA
jgi:hypothetical protein